MALPRGWWMEAAVAATSLAALALTFAFRNVEEGPRHIAVQALVAVPLAIGLAAAAREARAGSRLWWMPALAFAAGVPTLLDIWADYSPPPGEEGCFSPGFLPPGLGGAGQRLAFFVAPWVAVASIVAGAVLLRRPGNRRVGALCLLAALALAAGLSASMLLCAP